MNTIVRFIMNTPRLSNVIVTDLKITDRFSFSSEEKSSLHNTISLEAEGLYQRIPRCIHTNTVHRTDRIEDCPCTMYRRSKFSTGHIPVFSRWSTQSLPADPCHSRCILLPAQRGVLEPPEPPSAYTSGVSVCWNLYVWKYGGSGMSCKLVDRFRLECVTTCCSHTC